jgi:hypothetical protein
MVGIEMESSNYLTSKVIRQVHHLSLITIIKLWEKLLYKFLEFGSCFFPAEVGGTLWQLVNLTLSITIFLLPPPETNRFQTVKFYTTTFHRCLILVHELSWSFSRVRQLEDCMSTPTESDDNESFLIHTSLNSHN